MRTGDARRPRGSALRPGQDAPVRLRGIGRREHEGPLVVRVAELAEPLDGAGERELRAAETPRRSSRDDRRRRSRAPAAPPYTAP